MNPRPFGLEPKSSALDHSAKLSFVIDNWACKFYILFSFKHNKIICTDFIKEENKETMNKLDYMILNGTSFSQWCNLSEILSKLASFEKNYVHD